MTACPILIEGLTRHFDNVVALEGVTFSVAAGELVALLGPNGAGKTTAVRILATLLQPTAGRAQVLGYELGSARNHQLIRSRIGFLTETPGLYDRLSAWYNLLFFARLYLLPDPERSVESYLKLVDLWERRDDLAATFSKGMKQRLALARALIHEPSLVFLDEPTAGLDPAAALQVRNLLTELKRQGRTILLTTHNLYEAERLADRIIVLKRRLLAVDRPDALRRKLFGSQTNVAVATYPEDLLQRVLQLPFVREVTLQDQVLKVRLNDPERENPVLIEALVNYGVSIRWVTEERASLEDVYLDLIQER